MFLFFTFQACSASPAVGSTHLQTQKLITAPLVGALGDERLDPSLLAWSRNHSLAQHAWPAARASSLLISAFPVHSTSFSPKPLQTKTANCLELVETTLTCH